MARSRSKRFDQRPGLLAKRRRFSMRPAPSSASRSGVRTCRLVSVAASLVEEQVAGREGAELPEAQRAAALDLIARGEGKNLLGLKLIRDLLDRWFSVEDVIKLGRVALVEAELSPASEIHWPQLLKRRRRTTAKSR